MIDNNLGLILAWIGMIAALLCIAIVTSTGGLNLG